MKNLSPIGRLIFFILLWQVNQAVAQVPNISYAGPQNYVVGAAILPLIPSNSGGAIQPQVALFAGNTGGSPGSSDGAGASANFYHPAGMTVDGNNNIYLADEFNNKIRKITPSGVVSTFAGSGSQVSTDGYGTGASFYYPSGVVIDATSSYLYVTDYGSNKIRKINILTQQVTTIAGSGTAGESDGQSLSATFNGPLGIAIDAAGTLYIADYIGQKIRKITSGYVSTLAGSGSQGTSNGQGAAASFYYPCGLRVDAGGNIFVTDRTSDLIRKITPGGLVSTIAGNAYAEASTDGTGTAGNLYRPSDLVLDGFGNGYVTDYSGNKIRKVNLNTGAISTIAGTGAAGSGNGNGSTSTFNGPFGITMDALHNLYISDIVNNSIRKITTAAYTIAPALPQGLVFDTATGVISGSPSVQSPATIYTVTATNSYGSRSATVSIATIPTVTIIPSQNQNYVITYTPRTGLSDMAQFIGASYTDLSQSIAYFDGLGRPSQTVQVKGNADATKDLVQPFTYDVFGRETTKYLPYASPSSGDGSYKSNAFAEQQAFYNSPTTGISVDAYPYAGTLFEPTPLNRPVDQGATGLAWQLSSSGLTGSGNTIKTSYGGNSANDVRAWVVTGNGATGTSYYAADSLFATTTLDEKNNATVEFKDKEDKIVCKRVQSGTGKYLNTYYVYDDFDNLTYVIPPLPDDVTYPTSFTESDPVFMNFLYGYRYDERNRLVQKKIPGKKGWDYIVYNQLDQPVLTQDPVQRGVNEWTVNKYDAQGRVIITGLWSPGSVIALSTLQNNIYAAAQWDVRDNSNTVTGYNVTSYPALNTVLRVNYYDDYDFNGNPYTDFTNGYTNSKGLLTGTKTTILKADGNYGQVLWAVHCYDDLGRMKVAVKQHYKGGSMSYDTHNYDVTTITYNFDNTIQNTSFAHIIAGTSPPKLGIGTAYYYDHLGRPKQIWKSIWEQIYPQPSGTLISQTDYNDIGQVKTKRLHSLDNGATFKQVINYAYNERGWLSAINNPSAVNATQVFAEQLQYNTGSNPQFNGNIASVSWQTMVPSGASMTQQLQSYTYTYDPLNRLIQAIYNASGSVNKYNELVTYDNLGNIRSLQRSNSTSGQYFNNFTYDYASGGAGNRLYSITDAGTALSSGTYTYDDNGNANKDSRNSITDVKYNRLNLPGTVTRTAGAISYLYSADGEKLQKTSGSITREYIDDIEYNNGAIEFVKTEEGRAIPNGNTYIYEYYLKDHLGNTRAAVRQDGSISQIQDYYAFGSDMGNGYTANLPNSYKYNGKEKQEETKQYDYGARFYDPVIGRWTSVDLLSEKYDEWTPYNFVKNNPVIFLDPDGREIINGSKQGSKEYESTQSALKILSKSNPEVYATLQASKTRFVITYATLNAPEAYNVSYSGNFKNGDTKVDYNIKRGLSATNIKKDADGNVTDADFEGYYTEDEQEKMRAQDQNPNGKKEFISLDDASKLISIDGDVNIRLDRSLLKDSRALTITLGHEFGHGAFSILHTVKAFLWSLIGSNDGHDKNNPNGQNAKKEEAKARDNYRKAKKESEKD